MKWLNNLTNKDGIVSQMTGLADKAIVDKDKRNEFIYNMSLIMMQSEVAKYVRAVLGVTVVISCLFFADKLLLFRLHKRYASK
jgi:hypothetical protein